MMCSPSSWSSCWRRSAALESVTALPLGDPLAPGSALPLGEALAFGDALALPLGIPPGLSPGPLAPGSGVPRGGALAFGDARALPLGIPPWLSIGSLVAELVDAGAEPDAPLVA